LPTALHEAACASATDFAKTSSVKESFDDTRTAEQGRDCITSFVKLLESFNQKGDRYC
jgi:hypothetical protein